MNFAELFGVLLLLSLTFQSLTTLILTIHLTPICHYYLILIAYVLCVVLSQLGPCNMKLELEYCSCLCVCVFVVWGKNEKEREIGGERKNECRLREALVHFTYMWLPRCPCRLGLGQSPHRPNDMLNARAYILV